MIYSIGHETIEIIMVRRERSLGDLISEAERHPVSGWDFSWLGDRMEMSKLGWSFSQIVLRFAKESLDLLDLGTGGGEWLADLPFRPTHTVATEAWPPNVPIATRRLVEVGVEVVQVEPAPDNNQQGADPSTPRLPFSDGSFHLVIDRHESFIASEVARILTSGGHFVTQQFGDGTYEDFRDLFNSPLGQRPRWMLPMAVEQLESAGLTIEESAEGRSTLTFADVGALVWYLRMVPWIVPGFSVAAERQRLAELQTQIERQGPLAMQVPAFYVVASKT